MRAALHDHQVPQRLPTLLPHHVPHERCDGNAFGREARGRPVDRAVVVHSSTDANNGRLASTFALFL